MATRKRYAVVGTGGRSVMFIDDLASTHRDTAELAAFCDLSATRMAYYNQRLQEKFNLPPVPAYAAADFDRMVKETKPDVVIVASMDCTHHEYIIRAMELGCDAISEKPMTVDAPKANAIFDAIRRTGRNLRVTFNYRYAPAVTKVYELLRAGVVGRPLMVDFSWVLDTSHGADYFRRWHAQKINSGGLLVHKATHHFDVVNWWLQSYPETVYAMGDLKFYGRGNAVARGDDKLAAYPRYTGYPEAKEDPFALFLDAEAGPGVDSLRRLYLEAEKDSGYLRDQNVFSDRVTIEDSMAVIARYRNGVMLSYSLLAYSPWEGYRAAVTGDRGRLELYDRHGSHIIAGQSDSELAAAQAKNAIQELTVFPMFGVPYSVEIPKASGSHGGSDPIMLEQIFGGNPPPDPFNRAASHIDGAASILLGVAANESMRTGLPVRTDDLLKLP